MVGADRPPPLPLRTVSLPIHTGEALVRAPETMRRRIKRAAAGVIEVVSLTVTQSNWASEGTTLRPSTWVLSEYQVSLSLDTSGKYCNWRAAALVRRLNFIARELLPLSCVRNTMGSAWASRDLRRAGRTAYARRF